MTKIKNHTIVISIVATVTFLLWFNSYTSDSGDYYSIFLGIINVIIAPLLMMIFVKLYKKYEINTSGNFFVVLFVISAIPFWREFTENFDLWFHNNVFPIYWHPDASKYRTIASMIVLIVTIAVPLLAILIVKLYKKRKGSLDENILFIICIIPFLLGLVDWIINWGSYIILFALGGYDFSDSHCISPIGGSIAGNINLVKGMVITYMSIIVVKALKKEHNMKYSEFLPKLFILVGIHSSVCNLKNVIHNITFYEDDVDYLFYLFMDMLGSFVPLQLALVCVMVTILCSFLYGYFVKSNSAIK